MSVKEVENKFLSNLNDWIIDGPTISSFGETAKPSCGLPQWFMSPETEILYEDDDTMTVRYRFVSEEQKKHYMNAHGLKKDIKK